MGGGQATGSFDVAGEDLPPAAAALPLGQRDAVDQLHGDENAIADEAEVVDGDDVAVGQPRQRMRFAEQAYAQPRRHRSLAIAAANQLERDEAAQDWILRAVDDSHGAGAELRDDLVATETRADGKAHAVGFGQVGQRGGLIEERKGFGERWLGAQKR